MDLLPFLERFGFPVALVIYFLWEAGRIAKRIEKIQEDRIEREREFAEQYRSHCTRVLQVVDKTNTILERVLLHLDLNEKDEDTRVLRAFEPIDVSTPPAENRKMTEDETTRHRQAKELLKHRSPRP
jgi:hypothetical protein